MEAINKLKSTLTLALAGISAALGWFGWLVVAFVGCLALDYVTGTLAAGRVGAWESSKAREGAWHKLGSIVAVLVTAIADSVLAIVINNIPGITLPFEYTVFICPVVVIWYIFTELGSIAENAEKLGAPLPPFLQKILAVCKSAAEETGGKLVDKK